MFSIAAIPGSLMLQHKQPLGSDRKAVFGAAGSDEEEVVEEGSFGVKDIEVALL
jgi:hypothetical protein